MTRGPAYRTEREEQILACIRRWITDHGEGPSVRQIASSVGLRSTSTVAYHLAKLEARGDVSREDRRWRTCRLGR